MDSEAHLPHSTPNIDETVHSFLRMQENLDSSAVTHEDGADPPRSAPISIPVPPPPMPSQSSFVGPNSPPDPLRSLEMEVKSEPGIIDLTEDDSTPAAPAAPTVPESPKTTESYPNGLPLLVSSDSDTLVYIDPLSNLSSSDMACPVTTVPHRIHSRSLLDTGSSFFQKLLQPTYQFRILKRRDLSGRLPDKVKYVINLTPPTVEDEAVITIMELSCPLGVRSWASKQSRWNLPHACVGGQDEFESIEPDISQSESPDGKPTDESGMEHETPQADSEQEAGNPANTTDTAKTNPPKKPRLPVEYSATRHRTAIDQILHVLEGFDVQIDTPCKVWTFFALANIFDVAKTPRICDRILAWFYEGRNTRFIELHPEVTYRVACGVKSTSLCQVAFSILVGEEALLLLTKTGKPTDLARPTNTFHGRARDTLDDTELQRVEYASKSFMEHVLGRFVHLAGAEMTWLTELDEYQKVLSCDVETEDHQSVVSNLLSTMKNFVRGRIYSYFLRNPATWVPEPMSYPSAMDDDDYPPEGFRSRYRDMRFIERIMSRTFWGLLRNEQFHGNWTINTPVMHSSIADLGDLPAFKDQASARIAYVGQHELKCEVERFNHLAGVSPNPNGEQKLLDLHELLPQISQYVWSFACQMTQPHHTREMPLELTDTLTCLTDHEYKFLPLWAEGNDDGSGGVFTDHDIPIQDADGFSAPGPVIRTGSAAPSDSSYTVMSKAEAETTVQGASHWATESHQAEGFSMPSMISSLHGDVEEAGMDHGAVTRDWNTEDDAPSPDGSDSDNESGPDVDGDVNDTAGERESISDFLSDDDVLELDLDDGDGDGEEFEYDDF